MLVKRRARVCKLCGIVGEPGSKRCACCGARLRWDTDDSLELTVTGAVAEEVETVTRHILSELVSGRSLPQSRVQVEEKKRGWWTKSKAAWAFVIGLATVLGAAATVMALFVH